MAQIYVFGRVMHELTPKESQSKQPYVCFDLMERSGGEHPSMSASVRSGTHSLLTCGHGATWRSGLQSVH